MSRLAHLRARMEATGSRLVAEAELAQVFGIRLEEVAVATDAGAKVPSELRRGLHTV
jgi:hypothetical protein